VHTGETGYASRRAKAITSRHQPDALGCAISATAPASSRVLSRSPRHRSLSTRRHASDLGTHALRDLAPPRRVIPLAPQTCPTYSRRCATSNVLPPQSSPPNSPASRTPEEIDRVRRLLIDNRLVTLTGRRRHRQDAAGRAGEPPSWPATFPMALGMSPWRRSLAFGAD